MVTLNPYSPMTKTPGSPCLHNFNVHVLGRGSLGTRIDLVSCTDPTQWSPDPFPRERIGSGHKTRIDLPLHWSNMTSLYFHSSKLCVRYIVILRCSVALLKICFGTETVAEGEVSCEAPPPLHPLPVLLTLAGEGSGEKL